MSDERFSRLVAALKERLVDNPQVADDYRGDLRLTMNQGGLIRVWVVENEVLPVKKRDEVRA